MRRKTRAVLWAVVIILVFVAAPSIILWYLPSLAASMATSGMDVRSFITIFALIGIALAILTFLKNVIDDWSPLNLTASIAAELVDLYLFLFLIGLGDASGVGLTRKMLNVGPGASMFIDLRFFIVLYIIVMAVSAAKTSVNFYLSRKERSVSIKT